MMKPQNKRYRVRLMDGRVLVCDQLELAFYWSQGELVWMQEIMRGPVPRPVVPVPHSQLVGGYLTK